MNSICRSKRIHRGTWCHPGTKKWKRLDYICTTPWLSKYVRQCRAYAGPSPLFDTDHRLVTMDIDFPATKRTLKKELSRKSSRSKEPKLDYTLLRTNPEIQEKLTVELDKQLLNYISENDDVDTVNTKIVSTVKNAVEAVCPKSAESKKKKEPWEDAKLKEMMSELHSIKDQKLQREMQKKIKKHRIKLKNDYFKELADNINGAAEAREVEKEFALAKKFTTFKRSSRLAISNEKLKTHFQDHFAARPIPLPPEIENPEQYPYLYDEQIEVNESVPDENEIQDVLKTFKNNKSSGTDKIKTECLKYNKSQSLLSAVVLLMTLIWNTVTVPTEWLHATITCLFKKGIRKLASNYRGISIGANMSRILAKIIILRLKEAYEKSISEAQFGFRQNRSTNDGIFVVRNIIQKYNDTLIAVYIDLTAAYDHVPRDFLFRVLSMRTGAHHLIAILKKMYENTTACIRGTEAKFDILIGCRQGGQESPCIFNYYFDYVLKIAAHEIDKAFPSGWGIDFEYNIPYLCSNREQRNNGKLRGIEVVRWILYADDVVLFCKTSEEAEQLLIIINDTCKRFGLTISFKKTKTQVFNNKEMSEIESLFSIDGNVIENEKEFVYLGKEFSVETKHNSVELQISKAMAKFNEYRTVFSDRYVHMGTKRKLLEACVRMRLTYSSQAWLPNEKEITKMESCWSQMLRSLVRGGWKRVNKDEGDYSFCYNNDEVMNIVKTVPIRNFVYEQHLKYIGHVCRGENYTLTKMMLFAKPQRPHFRDPWLKYAEILNITVDQSKKLTQNRLEFAERVAASTRSPP